MKLEARFRRNADDYVESQRAYTSKTTGYRLCLLLAAVTSLYALYKVIFIDIFEAVLLVFLAGFWLLPILLLPSRARINFNKRPALAKVYLLLADEEGLRMISEGEHTATRWSGFLGFRETPNLFLIFCGQRQMISIPKRAFLPLEIEQFRELLLQKLPRK